ncbi:MAG: diguanylate cyclase [Alphaproteobacteria bacterium]|nr:diguanylate cyclase [Alphaproteobacteria bacterium]
MNADPLHIGGGLRPSGTALEVLLVEDDVADAGLVRHALKDAARRFRVAHVTSLAAALGHIAAHACDVVLLDLSLPDSFGLDTVRRMREAAPGLPLVVLTGHEDEEFAVRVMAAGPQDYLFKGETDGPALKRAIRYAIARSRMEEQLRQSQQRLHNVIALAQDAILVVDAAHRITLANPAAAEMFAMAPSILVGLALDQVIPAPLVTGATEDEEEDHAHAVPTLRAVAGFAEATAQAADGRSFPVEVSMSRDGDQITMVVRDITERRRFEDELLRLATSDPLTGLANRRHFLDLAERELVRQRRTGLSLAVLMVDIDHFKRINDTYGHAEGDAVLRAVAAMCRGVLRTSDLVGRLGGEEFGIILPETTAATALEIAERLRLAIAEVFVPISPSSDDGSPPDADRRRVTASIGVSIANAGEASIDPPLARADTALYRAKNTGRNRVELETIE